MSEEKQEALEGGNQREGAADADAAGLPRPVPMFQENADKPVMQVWHSKLAEVRSSVSAYRRHCPECKVGVLFVRRDQTSMKIQRDDACTTCSQRVRYVDPSINDETFADEDLEGAPVESTEELNARLQECSMPNCHAEAYHWARDEAAKVPRLCELHGKLLWKPKILKEKYYTGNEPHNEE